GDVRSSDGSEGLERKKEMAVRRFKRPFILYKNATPRAKILSLNPVVIQLKDTLSETQSVACRGMAPGHAIDDGRQDPRYWITNDRCAAGCGLRKDLTEGLCLARRNKYVRRRVHERQTLWLQYVSKIGCRDTSKLMLPQRIVTNHQEPQLGN